MQEQAVHIHTQTPVSSAHAHARHGPGLLCCQGLAAMCCAPAATRPYLAGVKGAARLVSSLLWQMGTGYHRQGENNALPRLAQ